MRPGDAAGRRTRWREQGFPMALLAHVSNPTGAAGVVPHDTQPRKGKHMLRITRKGLGHLRRNTVGYLALTIALGGTSYAAVELPRDSVGREQLRAGAVGPSELRGARVGGDLAGSLPNPTLATLPAVRVDDDTQVELASATSVLMDLDDEVFDTAEMHPGNGKEDRIRVPRTGTYILSGEVQWEPNENGYRTLDVLQLNHGIKALGSSLVEPRHSTIQSTVQQVTAIARLEEGTTVALKAGQASGVDLEIVRGTLSAAFAGP
jgi:hypothetical protein